MKRILYIFSVLMLLASSVYANPLYTKTYRETVTGGVTHTNVQKFYGDYSLNIDLIKADLNNKYLSFDLLKNPKGCDKTDTVLNLANGGENVVAAVNADFFSAYKGDQNFSLGIEIKDGELLQSHIKPEMAAGFFEEGALAFSHLEFNIKITAPNGAESTFAHINKPTEYYGAVLLYTPDYNGGTSPFFPAGITVLTVENDNVIAKGTSTGEAFPIPENGYVLAIDDNLTPYLNANFNIGDKVKIELSVAKMIENTSVAFGGGTLLLKDGTKTPITHKVGGNHPRTAIGTNEDGTVIYFLTVDGRQTASRGVSLETLADICLEMGMVNAMNLDGGGSTAMVSKTLSDEALHHINSPSEKRRVINAVAITSSAQKGETHGFIASAEKAYVLSGDTAKLYLTAHDQNYNKPTDTPTNYYWKVNGKGTVRNNVYYASDSGSVGLDLYFKNRKTDSVELTVIDSVCGINAPTEIKLQHNAEAKPFSVEVFDKDGNTAKVTDLLLLDPSYDKSFLSVTSSGITALREGSGVLTLSHGGAKRSIKVICGDYSINTEAPVTTDPFIGEGNGVKFNILGFDGAQTTLDRLVFKKGMKTFKTADISAVLGGTPLSDLTPQALSPMTAKEWSEYNHEYAKIVTLNLTSDNVLARGDVWRKLDSVLSSSAQKNIFILTDKKAGFVTTLDSLAFSNMLERTAKNKNVFVVYNGDENACTLKNGVRYISVADSRDIEGIEETVSLAKYLSFNLTENGANYSFKPLFPAQ